MIVTMNSSNRKNGNTDRIMQLIEEELQSKALLHQASLEIKRVNLKDYDIKMCLGCRACLEKGETLCPLRDDIWEILDLIQKADGIILGSPVYVEDVNGLMKNWIDRMAFFCHRPGLFGKSAIVLTTSGGAASNHSLRTMTTALTTWGFYVGGRYKFITGDTTEKEELKQKYANKISVISSRFLHSFTSRKLYNPKFLNLLIFKVQQRYWIKNSKISEKYMTDYFHWKDRGWLESNCTYYMKIKSNWLKVRTARMLGAIIAIFFV